MSDFSQVRLRTYSIGPRGGRKLEATRIVSRERAKTECRREERRLGNGFEVTIQTHSASGGPIRPRA